MGVTPASATPTDGLRLAKPMLATHVLWHPGFTQGREIAEALRRHFRRDVFRNVAEEGLGLSVQYRSQAADGSGAPLPIDFTQALTTIVVALVDDEMASDPAWVRYLAGIRKARAGLGLSACFIPVSIHELAFSLRFPEQCPRWHQWEPTDFASRLRRLTSDLTYQFACMLRHHLASLSHPAETEEALNRRLQPVKVFVSHSKHDAHGEVIAKLLVKKLHDDAMLSSFFDARNIPSGAEFPSVMLHEVRHSAVVAIHTDSYSSREWCRREIIEAKRHHVPLVVASCLADVDERVFPYLGNVPTIRMEPADPMARMGLVIDRLLDEVLKDFLWRCRTRLSTTGKAGAPSFLPRLPELITLAGLEASSGRRRKHQTLVHPDPPLGAEEAALFEAVAPHLHLTSLTNWLAHRGGTQLTKDALCGVTIGIAISESPDAEMLGLSRPHVQDALCEVSRHLLAVGATLAYGGDLRVGGFTDVLLELARRHHKSCAGGEPVQEIAPPSLLSYLPWPVHVVLNRKEIEDYKNRLQGLGEVRCLRPDGSRMPTAERLGLDDHAPPPTAQAWCDGLSAMRATMTRDTRARIAMGGRFEGQHGPQAGVAEEVRLALDAGQPVYLLGGFGGCTRRIAEAMGLAPPWPGSLVDWPGASGFTGLSADDLHNGLTPEENALLAVTPHIDQAIALVLRGLKESL